MAKAKEGDSKPAAPPRAEKVRTVPKELTFMDDKRAQYARLVISNYVRSHAKQFGLKAEDVNVNSVSSAVLLKAGKELAGGNMLDGKQGIEFIKEHSANGSTTGRALTDAYASEVRPFIRGLKVSEGFGRRGGLTEEEIKERDAKKAAAAEAKKADADKRRKEREEKSAAAKAKKDAEEKAKAEKAKADAAAKEKAEKESKEEVQA